MSDWAEWLVASGQADEEMVAEAERVLEAAALVPGDTVLDVGSGLGLLTLAAHDRIGDGWVIAVDPSVGALEELLRLAHEAKANGIMYLVGDAEVLPLPDASVDAAVLALGARARGRPRAAVDELARVLRPGAGSRCASRWTGRDDDLDGGRLVAARRARRARHCALGERRVRPAPAARRGRARGSLAGPASSTRRAVVEDPGEDWLVTDESVDARLDARGGPATPSLRERWQAPSRRRGRPLAAICEASRGRRSRSAARSSS